MKKDNIEQLFKNLKNDFDIEVPNINHEQRFLNKLNKKGKVASTTNSRNFWKPFLSIAASALLIVTVFLTTQQTEEIKDLASVSPEMAQTQSFFAATITEELSKLKGETTPETKAIVDDALNQLKILENEYETLKLDLTESGDDNRVIYAMISNFQNRIELLENVLQQIEDVKQLKQTANENSSTI